MKNKFSIFIKDDYTAIICDDLTVCDNYKREPFIYFYSMFCYLDYMKINRVHLSTGCIDLMYKMVEKFPMIEVFS